MTNDIGCWGWGGVGWRGEIAKERGSTLMEGRNKYYTQYFRII